MDPEQRQLILSILRRADTLTVAKMREDAWPQATVVSFLNDNLDLYFGTAAHSQMMEKHRPGLPGVRDRHPGA